jgi:hypothetical protein
MGEVSEYAAVLLQTKGQQRDAAALQFEGLPKPQAFENSWSTYSQLTRLSTNAFR